MMRELALVNEEIKKRLQSEEVQPRGRRPTPTLFTADCSSVVWQWVFGQMAAKLQAFVAAVDMDHPDLGEVFDGALADDTDYSRQCAELICLARHAEFSGCSRTGPNLWQLVAELPKDITRQIDSPMVNRLNVRFLKSGDDRQVMRHSKRMQRVDLRSLCKKGEEVWNAQPEDFNKFIRFDMAYKEELSQIEKKAQRYLDLGCTDMHAEIKKTVDAFKQQIGESYYGFNRVSATGAAVILAKMHLYMLYQPVLLADFSTNREYRVVVDPRVFKGYNFIVDNQIIEPHRRADPVAYEPRLYPLHELQEYMSPTVADIVDLVDAFPEAGGKPIFDHFAVLVPGVGLPNERNNRFMDDKEYVHTFTCLEDGKRALDLILIKNKHITPILMGERDGRFYFISYFT